MHFTEFEKELKKIDDDLFIKDLTKYKVKDIVGIYWKDQNGGEEHICSMPPDIRENREENYQDEYGRVHRCKTEVLAIVEGFIQRLKDDPEFLEAVLNKEV